MLDHPVIIALIISGLLVLLLIFDWRVTRCLFRIFQAQPSRPPELIDLAADTPDELDDTRPTWLLLTRVAPAWDADQVAEICARVWQVPVNQHEHDTNFVIGEVPCLMLRNGDWHYLLTIGDEPYMDPEQIPETDDTELHAAFAAHQSWLSLAVVGTPVQEPWQGRETLQRSAQLIAELAGSQALVLLGVSLSKPRLWNPELMAELHRGAIGHLLS